MRLLSQEDRTVGMGRAGFDRKYEGIVSGRRLKTTIATKPQWLQPSVDLDGDNEHYEPVRKCFGDEVRVDARTVAERQLLLDARGVKIWNDPVYRLMGVDLQSGSLRANFCIDNYFRYRFANGGMQDELISALAVSTFDVNAALERRDDVMPLRRVFMPDAEAVGSCGSRICAGGVNVLTALARGGGDNDYGLILQKRSASVGSRQGQLTTIPGGHHQPTVSPRDEVRIAHTVRREMFKELFGGDESSRRSRRLRHDWYKTACPAVAWLDDHEGSYDLCLTAFGYSLVTGSYSFSVLLAIHDTDYWRRFGGELRANWEVTDAVTPIVSSKNGEVENVLKDRSWTDYGLITFLEGLQRLKALRSNRVEIPVLETNDRIRRASPG